MNIRMKMLQAVALESDAEPFYDQAKAFGERAAQALGHTKRSQITGLESQANSTQKVTDIFDYLKLRTARQKEWQRENLGRDLLAHLETGLRQARDRIVSLPDMSSLNAWQRQEVYLLLIRAFVAHLAAQYEYACQLGRKQT